LLNFKKLNIILVICKYNKTFLSYFLASNKSKKKAKIITLTITSCVNDKFHSYIFVIVLI